MGAMWLSGNVAERVIEFKKDASVMKVSEEKDVKKKEIIYKEIEISDSEDELEVDSDDFKKSVKKVYNKLKFADVKFAQTNIKHFAAYIIWRLHKACGDSWHPTKRQKNTVKDIGPQYERWFTICIKFSNDHWTETLHSGNAEYWMNTLKNKFGEDLVKEILNILPMCSKSLIKKGEHKNKNVPKKPVAKVVTEVEVAHIDEVGGIRKSKKKDVVVGKKGEESGKKCSGSESDGDTESESSSKKKDGQGK